MCTSIVPDDFFGLVPGTKGAGSGCAVLAARAVEPDGRVDERVSRLVVLIESASSDGARGKVSARMARVVIAAAAGDALVACARMWMSPSSVIVVRPECEGCAVALGPTSDAVE